MTRDLARLASDEFDAIVIGGGVYGLAAAWELAARGVSVALVERDDFAAATSFNSLRTIHGGIRALQHGAVQDMREFVRERRAFARMAPHLVRPLPFVVPTYRHPLRNRVVMRAFLALYDRLAADRNAGLPPSLHLSPSHVISRDECLRINPAIDPQGVTGGAVWHDYQLHSAERFAIALLRSACDAGAAAANHVEASALLRSNGRAAGLRVRDALGGGEFDIKGRVIVNAAGPWAWRLLDRLGAPRGAASKSGLSLAMNAVVARSPGTHGVGGRVNGRFLFMVPWRDRSIVGTTHEPFDGTPDTLVVRESAVFALLKEAAAAFPRAELTRADVRLVHRGLLPAVVGRPSHAALLKRSVVHDHRADGIDGLLTVVGVRYTTARATAARAADCVCAVLSRECRRRSTAATPLVGATVGDPVDYAEQEAAVSGLGASLTRRLVTTYGTAYKEVGWILKRDAAMAQPLGPACHTTRAEIAYSVREEMAIHLADVILRRTDAGAGGHPGSEALRTAAAVMAAELGWTETQAAREIAAVDEFYRIEY